MNFITLQTIILLIVKDIIKDLIEKLEAERKQLYIGSKTIKCRIINPDKFQADIVKRNNKISD